MITRREFAVSSAVVLTLGGPLGGAARADTISSLELMAKELCPTSPWVRKTPRSPSSNTLR